VLALLAQLAPASGDVNRNVARLEEVVHEHDGVDLAVFPELFLSGYEPARADELACAADSEELERVRNAAAASATAVIVGFCERTDQGAVANSAACIDVDGSLAAVYRKTHLFAEDERRAFCAGDELFVVTLAGRRVAPMICFDMEFPEPARALCREGAELLVTASANMAPYGSDHDLAARARALENRRPHLYVNRVGSSGGRQFLGGSRAIDAYGRVTASASAGTGAHELLLEVEVPQMSDTSGDVDYLQHVRRDLPVRVAVPHTGGGEQTR
jgi:predicted amidohydrolase